MDPTSFKFTRELYWEYYHKLEDEYDVKLDPQSIFHKSVTYSYVKYGHLTEKQLERLRNPLHQLGYYERGTWTPKDVDRDYYMAW